MTNLPDRRSQDHPLVYLHRRWTSLFLILISAGLANCNFPAGAPPAATLSVTQAYQTVAARLTQALTLTPANSALPPTQSEAATATPLPQTDPTQGLTPPPTQPISEASPTAICDRASAGADIDVTIPDNTQVLPGRAFTKTWRLQNAGTCSWTNAYALVWFSGEQLGAPRELSLLGEVAPGQTVEISVDMVAPQEPGTYQSNWKLRNASGVLFGIGPGGGSAFWVRIVVVPATTTTATVTQTATSTPTTTPTAGVRAAGPALLQPGDGIDLDTNLINNSEVDVTYQVTDQAHSLDPIAGAALTVFGSSMPTLQECQTITVSADPLAIDNLPPGTYLCYRTGMALPGWARLDGINAESGALSLEILTWTIP